jgi:SAM-dependent methyltransferase
MPALQRHEIGQWFTPAPVVELALSLCLPAGPVGQLRLLDPCCGDGAFLAAAARRGLRQLHGIDIDPAAVQLARRRVAGARIEVRDLFGAAAGSPGQFDLVVGNPPYVRQERLAPGVKDRLRQALAADWPELGRRELDRLVGRSDLAVACVARALRLTRPGGRLALVLSAALLHADYARPLWQLVARQGRVLALVDAPGERWFRDAAVNTVIALLERGPPEGGAAAPVQLARLRLPTERASTRLRSLADLGRVAELRQAPADRPERWAALLRAPAAWSALAARAGAALVPLGQLAEVRRGLTSGANDIFYLERGQARALGIERELLWPLLRSARARSAASIAVRPETTTHQVLVCPAGARELARYPAAQRYLAGHRDRAAAATLRARASWWALEIHPARLFLGKAYAARFAQPLASAPVVCDQRLYSLHPHPGIQPELLAAVLNASHTALALESLGRAAMGEGALEWTVADAAELPVIDPRRATPVQAQACVQALRRLMQRPVAVVADELGRPDRMALDCAVAALAGEPATVVSQLQQALVGAVHERNQRARHG